MPSLLPSLIAATIPLLAALALTAAAQAPATHQHSFGGAEQWAHVFDDPARDAWQKPHEVIAALALQPDAVVADIGSGTGYFAMRLATMLPRGRVYGVDIEPDMVQYLAERARREHRDNVVSVAGIADDPRLPERVDLVLMVDVYHHVDARVTYLRRLRSALKAGGRIAVIDYRPASAAPDGPPPAARIPVGAVEAEFRRAGYRRVAQHAFLPKQYFLVFAPA